MHAMSIEAQSILCVVLVAACSAGCEKKEPAPASSRSTTASADVPPSPPRTPSETVDKPGPKLPKAELTWHQVTSSAAAITLEPLENAAIARPFELDGLSLDSLLLRDGKVELLDGLFDGVQVAEKQSAHPIEGAWPEPLLLTVTVRCGRKAEGVSGECAAPSGRRSWSSRRASRRWLRRAVGPGPTPR